MIGIRGKGVRDQRRKLVLGGAMLAIQACAWAVARPVEVKDRGRIDLADFGGVPGAAPAEIIGAFNQAFAALKATGGGMLVIGPGVYNLGRFPGGTAITVSDLQNVLVSAYGAQVTMTTTEKTTPAFFKFNDPSNVTIAGLRFYDFGTDLNVDWRGALCIVVQATRTGSGFRTVDCVADNVVTFLQSQQESNRYMFEGFDIHATIRNSYYGVNPNFNGRFSRCNVNCADVRRAFIGFGAQDWDIAVTTTRTSGRGSNAHILLVSLPGAPVQNNEIKLTASGNLKKYLGLVSICHQGPADAFSYARNVKVNVAISNATTPAGGVVTFTAEPPNSGALQPTTISAWEDIEIDGSIVGPYAGPVITNVSKSSATTNSIYVSSRLLAYQDMRKLPEYFRIK